MDRARKPFSDGICPFENQEGVSAIFKVGMAEALETRRTLLNGLIPNKESNPSESLYLLRIHNMFPPPGHVPHDPSRVDDQLGVIGDGLPVVRRVVRGDQDAVVLGQRLVG